MKFIVETDLGHDPDDFLTICHLIAAGHEVVAVSLVPGSPEQVKLANFIRKRTGQSFAIGVAKPDAKSEKLGVHDQLLKAYSETKAVLPDGTSEEVLSAAFRSHSDAEVLVIGPAVGLGKVVGDVKVSKLTFQGGFLPYSLYRPIITLGKFEGREWMPTFNFNGGRKAVEAILKTDIGVRQFVGKNVCHTITFDYGAFLQLAPARCAASELYRQCAEMYLAKHDEKKLHDPTALVCHLHPDIGVWFGGMPAKREGGWTTIPGADRVLADVHHSELWHHLLNLT